MQQQIKSKSEWQHFHYWYSTALQGVFSTPTMKLHAPCRALWGDPGAAQRTTVQSKRGHVLRAGCLKCSVHLLTRLLKE